MAVSSVVGGPADAPGGAMSVAPAGPGAHGAQYFAAVDSCPIQETTSTIRHAY
jgi:hypothetical protein